MVRVYEYGNRSLKKKVVSIEDAEDDKNMCIYIHTSTVVGRGNLNKKAVREVPRASEPPPLT